MNSGNAQKFLASTTQGGKLGGIEVEIAWHLLYGHLTLGFRGSSWQPRNFAGVHNVGACMRSNSNSMQSAQVSRVASSPAAIFSRVGSESTSLAAIRLRT